jgi:hypothetical protein
MKWISYLWLTLTNLVALGVTIAILGSAYSNFEKLVLALLMLNYLRICTVEYYMAQGYRESTVRQNACFLRLMELLKDPALETEKEAASELADAYGKLTPKIWISLIFNGLAWFIVIWTIITAI